MNIKYKYVKFVRKKVLSGFMGQMDQENERIYTPKRVRTFSRASSDTGPLVENDALQASYNF